MRYSSRNSNSLVHWWRVLNLSACCLLLLASGCRQQHSSEAAPGVKYAVTTSWLECCLSDVMDGKISVVRICPPGSCPGHFDVSPGTLTELKQCRALFLFDFQQTMGRQLTGAQAAGLKLMPIKAPQGLCVPASYLRSCEAVCAALTAARPESKTALAAALRRTHRRMERLEKDVHARIKTARLEHARVAVSGHQAEFCRWLGLEAVASYSGGEATTPAELESLIGKGKQAGVQFVIANLQEGRQVGEALAWQLGAKLVTFSNFPPIRDGESSFDALVVSNVDKLIMAASARP